MNLLELVRRPFPTLAISLEEAMESPTVCIFCGRDTEGGSEFLGRHSIWLPIRYQGFSVCDDCAQGYSVVCECCGQI